MWARKDSQLINENEKVLFVDLGSNLGQGYFWFKQFFNKPNVSFELFEPNPNCVEYLQALDDVVCGKVKLHRVGVGIVDGSFDFFGLDDDESGKYSQGGSLFKEHNSKKNQNSSDRSIKVDVINLSTYLRKKSKDFDKIIVKMDIEGAELDLLEYLIKDGTVNLVDILYVEFHSQFQRDVVSAEAKRREKKILNNLASGTSLKVRIWH